MIQRMFVTLDTKKTNYKNVGKINHGDDLILELTVLSDGNMITFNDPMVDLLVKKSDGKMIRQNSGIEHIKPNKFVIEVSKDCVTSPGLSTNQLIINDNGRISTCMFYYTILNSLEEDIIESISSVEVLEQLDEYVIEARERMELLNNDINELEKLFGATSDKLVEAENARNEAEQNRISSEILRVNNENDRIEADNIRNQNEIDRSSSELVREQRESERILNEEERRQNESERMIDESTRLQNENARQSNESIRMNNETDRKIQENIRVTAETNRVNAETIRRNNENSRISNETKRQKAMNEMQSLIDEAEQNENARQSNESIRMSNETDRKIQENSRVTAEINRVNAETNRVDAETTRRNNENSRISNETERQKTIEEMKRLIDEANGFDDVYDSKIDFFGKEHDKLSTRLNADFDNVHQRINESELLPYEGCSIKADNSYYGLQKDTVIKGRTLHNILIDGWFGHVGSSTGGTVTVNTKGEIKKTLNTTGSCVFTKDLKAGIVKNRTYTAIFEYFCTDTTLNLVSVSFSGTTEEGKFTYRIGSRDVYFTNGTKYTRYMTTLTTTNTDNLKSLCVGYHGVMKEGTELGLKNVILLEGDHTQTPLEELPFIEGIESVGDKSKNLIPSEYSIIDNSYLDGDDVPVEEIQSFVIADYIKVNPNKTYILSAYGVNSTTLRLYGYDINKKRISKSVYQNAASVSISGCDYIRCSTFKTNKDVLQLEEGTKVTPYQEYYDGYKISGKSCGKNLFDVGIIKKTEYSTLEKLPNNKIKLIRKHDYTNNVFLGKAELKLKPNTVYKISGKATYSKENIALHVYTYSDSLFGDEIGTGYLYGLTMTTDSSGKCIIGFFTNPSAGVTWNNNDWGIIEEFQVEESKEVTPYEPYKESNYSYILNEPLRSLPNGVCDEIDLTTGVLTRRIRKVVLDGSENWEIQSTDTNGNGLVNFRLMDYLNRMDYPKNSICDRFPIGEMIADEKYETHLFGQQTLYLRKFISSNITTVSAFKEWLQANPTTVIYELIEPTTEQLTPQQLKSFDTTTHIISDNKLMPVVSTKIPSNVQAIISTLKLENSDLKNNVEVLSVENEELKETNIVQDEMIDISMMATDEMYSMLEPLLENIPMSIEFENGVSKLVYMYVAMVRRGLKTLDEVPTRYREQVRAMIQYN